MSPTRQEPGMFGVRSGRREGATNRGRVGWVTALKRRAARTEFLMQTAVVALEHWDRLSVGEQNEFRELAPRAHSTASAELSPRERKRLTELWKKLEPKKLFAKVLRKLAADPRG